MADNLICFAMGCSSTHPAFVTLNNKYKVVYIFKSKTISLVLYKVWEKRLPSLCDQNKMSSNAVGYFGIVLKSTFLYAT